MSKSHVGVNGMQNYTKNSLHAGTNSMTNSKEAQMQQLSMINEQVANLINEFKTKNPTLE